MKRHYYNLAAILLLLALTVALLGCSGSGGSSPSASSGGAAISGGVTAPGGVIAHNWHNTLRRMLARLFIGEARAGSGSNLPGVSSVGAGVVVSLIQIDSAGNRVGGVLAMTTTDRNGNYTLIVPAGFTPGPNFVVVAGIGATMVSFATGTSVDVNPYTGSTVSLITDAVTAASGQITGVSVADINAVQQTVTQTSGDVPTTSTTASALTAALNSSVNNNVESSNIVNSIPAAGVITGTVTDSSSVPLSGIQIIVRTFGDQTTTALTRTDASGSYTVHVPAGNYIVGALNDTTTSMAASQWWTSLGGVLNQFQAEKVQVATTPVTINFTLPPGGRISGTVAGGTPGNTLPGIWVYLNDFSSSQTLMFIRTQPDGTYNFNVAPTTGSAGYYLTFRNSTLAPYGTGVYAAALAGTGGGPDKTQADKITIAAGGTTTASMVLALGGQIVGTVTDGTNPVAGMAVRFQDSTGAYAESLRTAKDGTYSIWLQAGSASPYNIFSRGQQYSGTTTATTLGGAVPVTVNVTSPPANFPTVLGTITGTVKDASGNPVGGASAYLYDPASSPTTYQLLGWEITDGDGTFTLYGQTGTGSTLPLAVGFYVTDGRSIGSVVYNGQSNYPTAATKVYIPPSTTVSLGTITLPVGNVLSGVVTNSSGGAPRANSAVQVRNGGNNGNYRLLTERTMSDGSYSVSLPATETVTRIAAYPYTASPSPGTANTPASNSVAGSYAYTSSISMSTAQTVNLAY